MTRARTLADLISDGVIGTTELADDAITPVKLDAASSYTMDGLTLNGNLDLQDDDRILLGTGDDLVIRHDGLNSYISDAGTGALIITAADQMVIQKGDGTNRVADFHTTNGTATLKYQGNNKLATKSDGVDITGELQADSLDIDGNGDINGQLTIRTADNLTQLTLTSTDGDANEGPRLDLKRDSASPADQDLLGTIRFLGDTSGGSNLVFAEMQSVAVDVTDATLDSQLQFFVRRNNALTNALAVSPLEVTLNESGNDVNFRVESDSFSHALFVEGDTGAVGINESDPDGHLHITGNNTSDGATIYLQEANNNTSDTLGSIFFGNNVDSSLARIVCYTNTNNTTSHLRFMATDTGTAKKSLDLKSNEAVFNENGEDIDFRVESDTNANMLFVDGGLNAVGIGTGSPVDQSSLTVAGSMSVTGSDTGFGSGGNRAFMDLELSSDRNVRIGYTSGGTTSSANIDFYAINNASTLTKVVRMEKDGDLNIINGNLVIASGHGIDFSATSGAGTSELFDDYEEGTYTVGERNGQATLTTNRCHYVRIGKMVFVQASVTVGSTTNGNHLNFTLPFTSSVNGYYLGGGTVNYHNLESTYYHLRPNIENAADNVFFYYGGGVDILTCAQASGHRIDFAVSYMAY